MQLEVYLLVRPKLYHQAHFKHIYDCSVCTLLYISKRTKKFTLTFILHPFTHLTVFWGIILKGVPYTLSFAIPVAFGLSYLWLLCVILSRLLTVSSSVPWFTPTYVSFIVLELQYMLALSKELLNFEIIQVPHFFNIETWIFRPWIWILFFSQYSETKHG